MSEENNQQIVNDEEVRRIAYESASDACNDLDSKVPMGLAKEQIFFNRTLRASLFDVDAFVMKELHYDSVEDLCKAFAKEQIDAIATAIYNWRRTGNAIIVSDQTGLGKGRIVAGLIRWSILELQEYPVFFTEKKNLFSDIYRDLYDIGLDAAIPIKLKTQTIKVDESQLTDSVILEQIKLDIKEGELRVDYNLPEDTELSKSILDDENIVEELIDLYRDFLLENGITQGSGYDRVEENLSDKEAKKLIKFDIESIGTIRFYELPADYNVSKLMNDDKTLNKVIEAYKNNLSLKKMNESASKENRMRIHPFCPFDIKIKNKQGDILYEVSQADYKAFISSNRVPAKYDKGLMLMLYTTLQRSVIKDNGEVEKKGSFIFKHCANKVVILDESHNAAGQSKRNQVMTMILRSAKYVSYVSATWSKRPDNMPIYAVRTAIKDSFLSNAQLINAFMTGGLALQEAVSSSLVQDGQLVRREKEYEGEVIYYQEDEKTNIGINQINKLNRVAAIWETIKNFQKEVYDTFRNNRSTIIRTAPVGTAIEDYRKQFKFAGKVNRFTFQVFSYFLLALKVRQTAEEALKKLRDGKKVVITIANTLESAFSNIQSDYLIPKTQYNLGDSINNDFSEILKYMLSKTMQFKFDGVGILDDGTETNISETFNLLDQFSVQDFNQFEFPDEVYGLWFAVRNDTISNFEALLMSIQNVGVSLSPMDEVMSIIKSEKEGFTIDEITGRTKKMMFFDNNYDVGILSKREKSDKMDIINAFNSNELDALIINQSGSTGLSLHAIPTLVQGKVVPPVNVIPNNPPKSLLPKQEVKQRCMIIMQMDLNISTEIQKLGRINRNGQVFPPLYVYITSAIPSEARLNAMMQRKLQSLMATTAGSQEYGKDVFDYDDLFSEYAVYVWNEVVWELAFPADFRVNKVSEIYNKTKLLYFMDYDSQKNFYFMLSERLRRRIAELKERGQYFAAIQYQDYKAKTTDIIPYIIGNNESISQFGKHTYAELCDVTTYDRKNTETSIKKDLVSSMNLKENGESLIFNDLEQYQNKSIALAENLVVKHNEIVDMTISRYKAELEGVENQIKSLDETISKMPSLEEVIALEKDLIAKSKEKDQATKRIVALIESGEDSKEETRLIQQLKGEIDSLSKSLADKIKGYESSDLFQEAYKNANRELKRLTEDKERTLRLIQRNESDKQEQLEIKNLFVSFVKSLGIVHSFEIYEEQVTSNENFQNEYRYVKSNEGEAVLYSVKFNFESNAYFILSEITIRLKSVTGDVDFALSELYKKLKEDDVAEGKKHTATLISKNVNYIDYWDAYIKDIDTAVKGKKVMLSGDLLRGLAMNQLAELGGNIVKYSTHENKLKVSLELNEASTKAVMPRFNEGLNYSIMFGLSEDNIKRIIPTMLANRVFEKLSAIANYTPKINLSTQILYDMSNVFLNIRLHEGSDLWSVIQPFCERFYDENDITYGDDESSVAIRNKFMQMAIPMISENMQSLRFTFQSQSEGFVGAFSSLCENMSFDYMEGDLDSVQYIGKSYKIIVANEAKSKYFANSNIAEKYSINEIQSHFVKYSFTNENALLSDIFIISRDLIEERAKNYSKTYFSPFYNLSMTYDAFVDIVKYLRAKFTELISVTSSECLSFATPRYNFDLSSSTTGLIDDIAGVTEVDGVGDAKIEAINDIVNEWLELYNA